MSIFDRDIMSMVFSADCHRTLCLYRSTLFLHAFVVVVVVVVVFNLSGILAWM